MEQTIEQAIEETIKITTEHKYEEGGYRFWLQKSGSLGLKLDGGIALYTIPKGSPLYDRLKKDLFKNRKANLDNDYAIGYYRFWLTEKRQLALKLNGGKELYTIPKDTPLYDRLMSDKFPNK